MNKTELERALKRIASSSSKPVVIILPDGTPRTVTAVSVGLEGTTVLHYNP